MYHCTKAQGITLLELLITVLLLSILLSLSLPSFSQWLNTTRMNSKILELHKGLSLARAQAVAMREDVKFCPLTESGRCSRYSEHAVLVFVDINNNNQKDVDDRVLQEFSLEHTSVRLSVSGGRPYIRYKRTGDSKEWGRVKLCSLNHPSSSARQLVISIAGRARLDIDSNRDGFIEDRYGQPVLCP